MIIYTSYFGALKRINENPTLYPISIARFSPKWYKGDRFLRLAPTPEMLKLDLITYTQRFFEILHGMDAQQIAAEVKYKANGKIPVLLCYEVYQEHCANLQKTLPTAAHIGMQCGETPKYFCHRHFVARWFNKFGIECEEYQPGPETV